MRSSRASTRTGADNSGVSDDGFYLPQYRFQLDSKGGTGIRSATFAATMTTV
jgi:hypothetical protein